MSMFATFTYISFFFVERSRATPRGFAGHFWPAGHRLGTPAVETSNQMIGPIRLKSRCEESTSQFGHFEEMLGFFIPMSIERPGKKNSKSKL